MRTIRTKVYKFNELSKDAQAKVIEDNYDINVNDSYWYEGIIEDAKNIGLTITSWDAERYVKGSFDTSGSDTAKRILTEHGNQCETYKTAQEFITDCEEIQLKAVAEGKDGDEDYWFEDEIEEIESEFLKSLCEDYRIILSKEIDYQTTEQAIIETIEANEYEFTAAGKMI